MEVTIKTEKSILPRIYACNRNNPKRKEYTLHVKEQPFSWTGAGNGDKNLL